MKIDSRKKWIKWVFEFVQMDLEGLSSSKKARLDTKVGFFSSSGFDYSIPERLWRWYPNIPKDISSIQDSLGDIVEWSVDVANSAKGADGKYFDTRPYTLTEVTPTMGIQFFNENTFTMYLEPRNEENEEPLWASYNFMQLLNGFPINMIGQCKCGKIFIKNRRNKNYCSNRCYQRYFRREEIKKIRSDPELYKAHKQAKAAYQRKRYQGKPKPPA